MQVVVVVVARSWCSGCLSSGPTSTATGVIDWPRLPPVPPPTLLPIKSNRCQRASLLRHPFVTRLVTATPGKARPVS
uniref:Putative secreted peptide n=1 Tax=Anopheles braziliensis TaxID=58242 RepID=A0A2M3ZTY2_9DIPT